MPNLNRVLLIGNATRDPATRYNPKGTAVADLSLAINRNWTDEQGQKQSETTFVEVTLWARIAEIAQQYIKKGNPVFIEGRLQLETWDDKQTGQKRSKLKVVGENLQLIGGRPEGSAPPRDSEPIPSKALLEQRAQRAAATARPAPKDPAVEQDDTDIPF